MKCNKFRKNNSIEYNNCKIINEIEHQLSKNVVNDQKQVSFINILNIYIYIYIYIVIVIY